MNDIFCIECKWYEHVIKELSSKDCCKHPTCVRIVKNPIKSIEEYEDCWIKNAQNNCKDFEKIIELEF